MCHKDLSRLLQTVKKAANIQVVTTAALAESHSFSINALAFFNSILFTFLL